MLATELYKVHHGLAPELMNNISRKRNVWYYFRKNSTFEKRNINSVYYGSETISFLGQKYGNFWQVTLKIQKISASSNQILNLGSLKTVHVVCASYTLQT